MHKPFEELSELDRLVHEPARLAILTALESVESADFLALHQLTGLTKGNLSRHLAKLEDGHLIEIEKTYRGKVPATSVRLTKAGRDAVAAHWTRLTALRQATRKWER